jgi:hypothetical protein
MVGNFWMAGHYHHRRRFESHSRLDRFEEVDELAHLIGG